MNDLIFSSNTIFGILLLRDSLTLEARKTQKPPYLLAHMASRRIPGRTVSDLSGLLANGQRHRCLGIALAVLHKTGDHEPQRGSPS